MLQHRFRRGFSLLELILVIGITGVLFGLMLVAVQKVRATAARAACAGRLRQIGLALHQYHLTYDALPPGVVHPPTPFRPPPKSPYPLLNWQGRILPFIEQTGLWSQVVQAYKDDPMLELVPAASLVRIPIYLCPVDPLLTKASPNAPVPGLTSYPGVSGTSTYRRDGLLYTDSSVRFAEITDGTSFTLMVGERPIRPNLQYGRWFGGWGHWSFADGFLGVQETKLPPSSGCLSPPYPYVADNVENACAAYHFWSFHPGGANFLFADGSVHFAPYNAGQFLPALATRAGAEAVTPSF